ncbi:MAG: Response regulator of zinc sigma-54-dependent two-component system [Labilithrix sp.]|nr:Response regulator of zinc sigma-54-dependent two-component system [Labilithrix sp.]
MSAPSVLVVEDEAGLRDGLAAAVGTLGYRALTAGGLGEARASLAVEAPDCILLDIRLKDGDGLTFLGELRDGPLHDVPVIVATAYGDSERTIRAMRDGAFDYLTKPFNLPLLLATVERAVKQRSLARSVVIPAAPSGEKGLVGSSAAMVGIWKLIGRAAASTAPVLITGETGVGKELVASAIHDYSVRASEPFVAVNLAALPASLLESELFGHEKGAFTGASARRLGRFELAAGGTLFLDEIGDLDPALQTKLLRVLQDGSFERVGGSEKLTTRARIIAATNKPVHPGEPGCVMREDLYYRLAVIGIEVPPLRARKSDIPLLVAHALRGKPARAASEQAMEALVAYDWPGNVRELVHVIERAAVLGGEIIDVASLPDNVRSGRTSRGSLVPPSSAGAPSSLRDAVSVLEKRMIIEALERANGNRSEAARQLGIGRPQLYAKMEEHGIGQKD